MGHDHRYGCAMILTDLVLGKSNLWEEIYYLSRFEPIESAKNLFSQVAEATKGLVGDRIIPTQEKASILHQERVLSSKSEARDIRI